MRPAQPQTPPTTHTHTHQLRTSPCAGPTWPGVVAAASGRAQVTRRPRVPGPGPGGRLLPAVRAGPAGGAQRRPSPRSHAAAGAREPSRVAARREGKVSPWLRGACLVPHQRAGEVRGVGARPPGSGASGQKCGAAARGPVASCVSAEASGGPRSWKPSLRTHTAARSPRASRVVPSDAGVALTARPTRPRRPRRSGADGAAKPRAARRSSPRSCRIPVTRAGAVQAPGSRAAKAVAAARCGGSAALGNQDAHWPPAGWSWRLRGPAARSHPPGGPRPNQRARRWHAAAWWLMGLLGQRPGRLEGRKTGARGRRRGPEHLGPSQQHTSRGGSEPGSPNLPPPPASLLPVRPPKTVASFLSSLHSFRGTPSPRVGPLESSFSACGSRHIPYTNTVLQ